MVNLVCDHIVQENEIILGESVAEDSAGTNREKAPASTEESALEPGEESQHILEPSVSETEPVHPTRRRGAEEDVKEPSRKRQRGL
jgi:hypothetical protein